MSLQNSVIVADAKSWEKGKKLQVSYAGCESREMRVWFPDNLSRWCLHPKSTIEKAQLPGHPARQSRSFLMPGSEDGVHWSPGFLGKFQTHIF